MPSFEEVIADTQKYPDSLEIEVAGTKIPLASLRAVNKSERERLSAEIGNVAKERENLSQAQTKALQLAEEAARIKAEIENDASTRRQVAAGADPFETDPFYAPVSKKIQGLQEKYDKTLEKLNSAVEKMNNTATNMATVWAEDRWDNEYEQVLRSVPEDKRSTVPSRKELLEYAAKENIKDRHNLPSVRKAWEKKTEGERMTQSAEEARKQGIEEGKRMAFAARIPKPSTVQTGGGGGPAVLDDWNKLTDAALADPEIARIIQGSGIGVS
jgi:hypothetical protein